MAAPAKDAWDQFPDAEQAAAPASAPASEWDQFPDAEQQPRREVRSLDLQADGSLVPTRSDYGPQDTTQADQWIQAGKNVAQAGAQAATGVTGAVAGDVASLGALAYDVTANAILHPFSGSRPSQYADPAAVRERVSSALTYQPQDPNNLTAKVLQAPGRVVSGAGDFMARWSDNPYLQDVLRAVPQAAASYLGVKAGVPLRSKQGVGIPRDFVNPNARTQAIEALTPEQLAVKKATDAGYRLTPTQAGNAVGGFAEGITGQAQLERSLSIKNATITDNLAKKALGIDESRPINSATLGIERAKASKAYDAVAKTGIRKTSDEYRTEISKINDRSGSESFPDDVSPQVERLKQIYGNTKQFNAQDAVNKIKKLRKDASANYKTRDPEKMAIGDAQRKIAEALDNELQRHVEAIGRPDLVKSYKEARVQLAKISTVEDALAGSNVSAKKIHQQWKRGAPLQGELRAIAETYDSFQHVMQEAAKVRSKHPFSVVDYLVALGSAGGAAFSPALLAGVVSRPVTRAALASKTYQRNFVAPKLPQASPTVTPKPAASSAALIRDDQRNARRAR